MMKDTAQRLASQWKLTPKSSLVLPWLDDEYHRLLPALSSAIMNEDLMASAVQYEFECRDQGVLEFVQSPSSVVVAVVIDIHNPSQRCKLRSSGQVLARGGTVTSVHPRQVGSMDLSGALWKAKYLCDA